MPRPLPVRGVIEGFYGPPWTHASRIHAIEFLTARGMNTYIYAPKDDAKHRARWREPYDVAESEDFSELAEACRARGARFGFAISPGLDIEYRSASDRRTLLAKLTPLIDIGVDWFVLALDDIPARPALADDQADLADYLHGALDTGTDVRLSLVPTEYVGTRPSPYLSALSAMLPLDIDIFWTGPTVCSPRITAGDARSWRQAIGDRPLLLWDNVPVNDAVMERELHLGPYRGRDPELSDVVEGILCNPMLQPRASLVALATAAEFCADPTTYDERAAWERAIDAVGGPHREQLRAIARACADGPLSVTEDLPAHRLVDDLVTALAGPEWVGPADALRDEMRALRTAADEWTDDAGGQLREEIAPWLRQGALEADAALAALRLVRLVRAQPETDSTPDAETLMLHCFALLFAWSAARDGCLVVLGPRFAIHPAVVQRPDGSPAVDVALALAEDCSAVDRLCRLALREYEQWVGAPKGGS